MGAASACQGRQQAAIHKHSQWQGQADDGDRQPSPDVPANSCGGAEWGTALSSMNTELHRPCCKEPPITKNGRKQTPRAEEDRRQ